ncbi:MAG: T9SS type A sorting domain-containing protein [Lentimicrobium sp.]|nr:T9SS type A sorting domain-containing protein [Lentimicrobium sp.]
MWFKRIMLILVASAFVCSFATAQVLINEGSNRNYSTLPDEDGEFPDWIELYNSGSSTVNLLNYSISDKLSNPVKWVFPDVELLPNQFINIYCSGKNRRPEPGFTHVLNATAFSPVTGWNTHNFTNSFYWDGTSGILINTCSYSSTGYTSNSVFNQTATSFLSTLYAVQDGASDVCGATNGTPVFQRPNMKLNGITIGTGEVQNSNIGYPAPYGNWYWCARHQMLIKASELTAAGFSAGYISNLSFDVVYTDPNTVYDYIDISMKLTAANSVSSTFAATEPTETLHTNFKISEEGETIYLYNPAHVLMNSLSVDCRDLDVSRGSFPDASGQIFLFQQGTPAASNNQSATYTNYLLPVTFSVPSGHYQLPLFVQMNNPNGTSSTIHYTTDGSDPTSDSPAYDGNPVYVSATTALKARAFQEGVLPGPLKAATYFYGAMHTTPVLSVITDNNNLYGGSGIFDNWWMDWEKAAYVEYFDSTQNLVFSQRTGMQIDGGAGGSRSHPQHSFRLEPGDGVLGDGPINYPLIPDRPERNKYSKFYLRNGSNQYLILPYKDATQVTSMSKGTNNYYAAWRPVSVYINGGYFGLYELREKIDAEYFETLEGADPDNTTILSQSYWYGGNLRAVEGSVEPFYASIQALNALDPANPAYWDQANALFDLTWYNDYIIGESWMGNTDWPWNNIKIYRSDASNYSWRYCIIDQELAMLPNGSTDCFFDHINFMMNQDPAIPHIYVWLKSIQNERFRNYFINRFADVMNTNYLFENISAIENNMFALTNNEMPNEYMRWGDPNNIPGQMENFTNNHLTLIDQFSQRTTQVRNHIESNFNLENQVALTLDVIPAGAGKIHISTVTPEVYPWQGVYFNGIPVMITAEPSTGYFFSHWNDNGLISDTLNAVFLDTLDAETINFTAIFGEEHVGITPPESFTNSFSLYPNPATEVIYLSDKNNSKAEYQIVDMTGHIIQEGITEGAGSVTSINISNLPPSLYQFRIMDAAKGVVNLHFIKAGTKR